MVKLRIPDWEYLPLLQQAARFLAMIPLEDFERYVVDGQKELSIADSMGPLLDPTGWRQAHNDGSFEEAKRQQGIVEHLLAARKLFGDNKSATRTDPGSIGEDT
jgi:hypothetical protein